MTLASSPAIWTSVNEASRELERRFENRGSNLQRQQHDINGQISTLQQDRESSGYCTADEDAIFGRRETAMWKFPA
jgi:hypothetical protein